MSTVASPTSIPRYPDQGFSAKVARLGANERSKRNRLVRRDDHDYSQRLRLGFQLAFLALNVWIAVQFYLWVRWAENGGPGIAVPRPAGVEGWLPIEGLMQLKYVLASRRLPLIHPAGFFLFLAFLLIAWLLRKSFCAWLCPVGTVSEYLWKLGRFIFRRNFPLPRWVDSPLRALKYILLTFFVYAVAEMSAASIAEFVSSPYGLVVDVRMLNFFRNLGGTAAYVILGLLIASLLVQNFWCRYLCPYGALMGLVALFSPARIVRLESACIDCAKCAKACPALLPVDRLLQIRSAECTSCLECIAVCPAKDALALSVSTAMMPPKKRTPVWAFAATIALLFVVIVGYARVRGHWETHLPTQVYLHYVPAANEQQHP